GGRDRDADLDLRRGRKRHTGEHGEREGRQLQITYSHVCLLDNGFFETLAGEYTSAPRKYVSGTFSRSKNAPASGAGARRYGAGLAQPASTSALMRAAMGGCEAKSAPKPPRS